MDLKGLKTEMDVNGLRVIINRNFTALYFFNRSIWQKMFQKLSCFLLQNLYY